MPAFGLGGLVLLVVFWAANRALAGYLGNPFSGSEVVVAALVAALLSRRVAELRVLLSGVMPVP